MDEKIIQTQLLNLLKPKLELFNIPLDQVKVDDSLLELGILDSMSFLDFIVSLEEKFEMELDFSDMEPSEFFTIQKLSKIIFQNHNGIWNFPGIEKNLFDDFSTSRGLISTNV